MKKATMIVTTLALAGAMILPAMGAPLAAPIAQQPDESEYILTVNGTDTDVDVCIMVPLRAVAEELGFTVTWDNGVVRVDNGVMHTDVTIGVDRYVVTTSVEGLVGMSAPFSLGAAPYVSGGVTYVPLELFDALLDNKEGAVTVDGNHIRIETEETQIPNPFTQCDTLDQAEELVGFSMELPKRSWDSYRVLSGEMIEAQSEDVRVRKAKGTEDISGNYTAYEETKTVDVDGIDVTFRGEDGKVMVATWAENDYTFAVSSDNGISAKEMTSLVAEVK